MMDITYTLVRSKRRTISIQITANGEVVVRCPNRCPKREVEAFLQSKRSWIETHLEAMGKRPQLPPFTPEELREMGERAAKVIPARAAWFAPLVGVSYGRITIRSQKTRWGSCSDRGNLNFNRLLVLCPPEVLDYVVVHELCHRKQMNHSAAFWQEVERFCPDYRIHRKWLKENGTFLIARFP